MSILPQGVGLDTEVRYVDRPTNTFLIDWPSRQIKGMDAGLAAMRQAVEIILRNERYRWLIYNKNFGSELEGLIGEETAYIESELPRRIKDAFSTDRRILSVENFSFKEVTGDRSVSLAVSFDVITVFGTISEEVTV